MFFDVVNTPWLISCSHRMQNIAQTKCQSTGSHAVNTIITIMTRNSLTV